MSKTYLPYEPEQQLLLPAALQEWLPDRTRARPPVPTTSTSRPSGLLHIRRGGPVGHVGGHRSLRAGRRGGPPYHPRMTWSRCCSTATASGWRPHAASPISTGHRLQGIGGEQHTGHPAISDFRKDNVDALSGLFVQVLALCQQAGLVWGTWRWTARRSRPTHRSIRR